MTRDRQHGLSQARTSRSSNESDNRASSRSNELHPIGSIPSNRHRTRVLTGRIALDVAHGTSARQLSPHFKSNKTPLPGTAWLDGTTRTVTDVPFLLTSLFCQPHLLFFIATAFVNRLLLRSSRCTAYHPPRLTVSHAAPHSSVLSADLALRIPNCIGTQQLSTSVPLCIVIFCG